MLTIAGGILLAIAIVAGVSIALGVITLPAQISFWLYEAKRRRFAVLRRAEMKKQYRRRLDEIESTGRERYPNEASSLRKMLG